LLALGDRPATELTLESLKELMRGSGETCLRLLREGAEIRLCIALKPLI